MRLGERQKLIVVKKVEFGVYLAERQDAGEKDRVLLPIKQVPAGTKEGDKLEVFIFLFFFFFDIYRSLLISALSHAELAFDQALVFSMCRS